MGFKGEGAGAAGAIRRHPDVPWLKRESDIETLARVQARLLERALSLTRSGGTLIYCTCSLEPEENEHIVAALLAREHGVRRVPITAHEVFGHERVYQPRRRPAHVAVPAS